VDATLHVLSGGTRETADLLYSMNNVDANLRRFSLRVGLRPSKHAIAMLLIYGADCATLNICELVPD